MEEDFSSWPSLQWSAPGSYMQNGWRFFGVNGAEGGLERFEVPDLSAQESDRWAVRLSRSNTLGDLGLDLDTIDNRLLVKPGDRLFVRVWARQGPLSDTRLDIRLAEFNNAGWLGIDNNHKFALTSTFQTYIFQVSTSGLTTEVSVALRVAGPVEEVGTGAIEIKRVEVGHVESASGATPVIDLPQGWVPVSTPTLCWRGTTPAAREVQLSRDLAFTDLIYNPGAIEQSSFHQTLPSLSPSLPVCARVRVRDFDDVWSNWSDPTVIVYEPMAQAGVLANSPPVVVYDLTPSLSLTPAESFEQQHLVSALQGLVNRKGPRLFVHRMDSDNFWLDRLRQSGRYLERCTFVQSPSIEDLVARFRADFKGVVLWDLSVPATSNIASTVAGADDLLPIPFRDAAGSLYQRLVAGGPTLPVGVDLVNKFNGIVIPDTGETGSGSAKNDAYRWAIARYIETGKCNPFRMGYYLDGWWINGPNHNHTGLTVVNHDFFIREKGFLWDLSVWGDENPIDDPSQPLGTDKTTFLRLLSSAAQRLRPAEMIHVGGFTPWDFKYTDAAGGHHGDLETEWETCRLLSQYNAFLDADAPSLIPMANASLYASMPKPFRRLNQAPPPTPAECIANDWLTSEGMVTSSTFVIHYIGDYDSAAWMMSQLPSKWASFRRGRLPLPWAWNANLMERAMPMFDEYMRTRTPCDALWSGDNGAGYLNPGELYEPRDSGLPDGSVRWQKHNMSWFRLLDQRHVGFVISGSAKPMNDECRRLYSRFAGDGIIDQYIADDSLVNNTPVLRMKKDYGQGTDPVAMACQAISGSIPNQANFVTMRSVLREPELYWQANRELFRHYGELRPVLTTPSEFFYLLRAHLGGTNAHRASFLYDTMPSTARTGQSVTGKIWLRNLGWDTWASTGTSAVCVAIEVTSTDQRSSPQRLALTNPVVPGQMVEVSFSLTIPQTAGQYFWRIDLVEGADGWFSDAGNLEESRLLDVRVPSQAASYRMFMLY